MIDAAGIQRMLANLDPIGIANEAERLRTAATGVRETGEDINRTWTHSLNPGVYEAPEGELLRRAARPVQDNSAEFAWGVWQVAGALEAYAEEIRPIKTRLEALLVDAHAFVLNADDDWREDEDQVAENNRLVGAVRDQAIALANAEENCASKIYAAYGGRAPGPMCVDGPSSPPPWGTAEEADLPWWEDAVNGVQSFGGGLWEVTWGGFSTLFGFRGREAAGEAWEGLGKWALSSAIVSIPGAQGLLVFDPVRDMVWNSNKEMVKGFAAWDEWSEDPARAAGMVFGNVLMLAGAKKVPTVARGAGKAARAANTGLRAVTAAGRALDPMTQLTYAGTRTSQILKALKQQGIESVRVSLSGFGPQLVPAGGPTNVPVGTGTNLTSGIKDLASTVSERVKNLINLAEGPKDPANSSPGSSTPEGADAGRGATSSGQQRTLGESSASGHLASSEPASPASLQRLGLTNSEGISLIGNAEKYGVSRYLDELVAKAEGGSLPRAQVAAALQDLDWAMNSGKLHANSYGQQIRQLNAADSALKFNQNYAEIKAVKHVIETVDLESGTKVLTTARGGRLSDDLGNGSRIDVAPVSQADLLYKTADGKIHVEEVKSTPNALQSKLDKGDQHRGLASWLDIDPVNHVIGYRIPFEEGWTDVFHGNPDLLQRLSDERVSLSIGDKTYAPAQLSEIRRAIGRRYKKWVKENPRADISEFFTRPEMRSVEEAMRDAGQ